MMLHRHFEPEEPKPDKATESGVIAEGADIVDIPAKKPAETPEKETPKKRTRKKGA